MDESMFPRNLYKSPGPLKTNHGKTYETILVGDENEYNLALEDGWIDSFKEALDNPIEESTSGFSQVEGEVVMTTTETSSTEEKEITFDEEDF